MQWSIFAILLAGQSAAQPAPPTSQQLFDQATAAAADGQCPDAVRMFETLETNAKLMRNGVVRAAIDVRKGGCLMQLGRLEEAEAALRRSLPILATKGGDFAEEVRSARLSLGDLAANRFDYSEAAAEYKLTLEGAVGRARIVPLIRLSQVLEFDQDGEAVRYAAEAREIARSDPALDKKSVATVQTQYARALLNHGRWKEGYDELKDSLRKQGGLDNTVGVGDLATRSDLAIAASLNKDIYGARKYLAYTGAGRFEKSPFATASSISLPPCDSVTGLKPEDYAIVEFSLADDGHVQRATPIYSTGGRSAALAFARAVTDWSWKPEAAKAIPALFRYMTRVEIRCTTAAERPSARQPLIDAFADWMESLGKSDPAWDKVPDAKAVMLQRAALTKARTDNDLAGQLAALVGLGKNSVIGIPERTEVLDEAMKIADMLKAPPSARSQIAITYTKLKSGNDHQYREGLRTLLARPDMAGDPLSAATLRLMIAEPGGRASNPAEAETLLDAVIRAPELPARHPLKVAALLERANRFAAKGDLDGARRMFDQTGLTTEQCAFLGLQPAMRRSGASSDDYPMDAIQMGFEGWVRTEFDVATDGSTIRPRVVTAYPPFVFNEAGTSISKDSRYTASYRPEKGVACTAQQSSVAFVLPK